MAGNSSTAHWALPWSSFNPLMMVSDRETQSSNMAGVSMSSRSQRGGDGGLGGGMPMSPMHMALLLQQNNLLPLSSSQLLPASGTARYDSYGLGGLPQAHSWGLPPTAPQTHNNNNYYDMPPEQSHGASPGTDKRSVSSMAQDCTPADAGYGLGHDMGHDAYPLNVKRRRSSPNMSDDSRALLYMSQDPRSSQHHSPELAQPHNSNNPSPTFIPGTFGDVPVVDDGIRSTRDKVRRYLDQTRNQHPGPGMAIYYPKIVQKSYGSEKRFFCPPPCVQLLGPRWTEHRHRDDITMNIEKTQTTVRMMFEPGSAPPCSLARTLYIADSDKLKAFSLEVTVRDEGRREMGTFKTGQIKVISKPSQKRQTKANIEMCIESGSEVCLFSRLRAQAAHTRYLQADQQNLFISPNQWSSLEITAASVHGAQQQANLGQGLPPASQLIEYGMDITLQNADYPLAGPRVFTIYPARGKNPGNINPQAPREPVASFHKVCLFLKGTTDQYLGIVDDDVNTVSVQRLPDGSASVPDCAVWTIIASERMDFPFYESHGPAMEPVAPCPQVLSVTLQGDDLELRGADFSSQHSIWFDDIPADTVCRSSTSMTCRIPSTYSRCGAAVIHTRMHRTALAKQHLGQFCRILLVRHSDGVVYPTLHYLTIPQ
eukprot:comp24203_c0_seq1/m.44451 comp24203_c0_seq1/g.44451  ORF comp24203_c0_seq1/g.44451 comp24203_c0_seq1/m.44451 type:complete len:654 (-) comp24203_c0_seq1:560-2521(-)